MTNDEAQRHFRTHRYDFRISVPGRTTLEVYCTTEDAAALSTLIPGAVTEPVHPEFLGWTPEEIARNAE